MKYNTMARLCGRADEINVICRFKITIFNNELKLGIFTDDNDQDSWLGQSLENYFWSTIVK